MLVGIAFNATAFMFCRWYNNFYLRRWTQFKMHTWTKYLLLFGQLITIGTVWIVANAYMMDLGPFTIIERLAR